MIRDRFLQCKSQSEEKEGEEEVFSSQKTAISDKWKEY